MHGQELNLLDKRTEGQKNKLALQILFVTILFSALT